MTVIVNKSADYSSNFVDFDSPISLTGVLGFFIMGVSAQRSIKNFGSGGDAVVVGAPDFGAQYARFTGPNAYLQTTIPETTDMSMVIVAKATVASPATTVRPCYVSNAVQGGLGMTFYCASASSVTYLKQGDNDGNGTYTVGEQANATLSSGFADQTVPQFLAARHSCTTGAARLKSYTSGFSVAPAAAGVRTPLAPATMRIGMNYSSNLLGPADMSLCVIASRQFSDSEEAALYTWAKTLMALRGVSI